MIIIKSKKKHPPHTEKTISTLKRKLIQQKVPTKTAALEDLELFLDENKILMRVGTWVPQKNNHVFFRLSAKYKNASYILSKYLELKKIPYIDGFISFTRERNKLIQMFLFAINNIRIPKTYYSPIYDSKKITKAAKFLDFPIVVKLTARNRGKGVFLAKNRRELTAILKENIGKETILQEFIPNDFDYRILVLGGKTVLGEKRIRTSKTDFRNNVSIGAKEEFVDKKLLSKRIKKISEKSSAILNIQVCGVDIIDTKKGPLVIEANISPSLTLGDSQSDELNILTDYLKKWSEKK